MRRVQFIMGMPITIEITGAKGKTVFEKAFERLKQIDERFSTYKKNSEVSRFACGELKENQLSKKLAEVIRGCKAAERQTGGYFSAWYSGRFDPSGYVKGWAIEQAGKSIAKHGYEAYCIAAGGDILVRSDGSKLWSIGIQDPSDKHKILNKLSISSGAIATSGSYERGSHIINPKTGKPATGLVSVSVVGRDIIAADVLATALFAAGERGLPLVEDKTGYEALALGPRGRVFMTSGMPKKLSAVSH